MPEPIKIVDYNPDWPSIYQVEKAKLEQALGHLILDIQHVGSTSVPGLAAKPIIDIAIGIKDYPMPDAAVQAVVDLGYEHMGEYGIPRRHYFRKGAPRSHHIHVVELRNPEWDKYILFRDYLRTHPDTAAGYEVLKRKVALQHGHDRTLYTDSKAPFIESVIEEAHSSRLR